LSFYDAWAGGIVRTDHGVTGAEQASYAASVADPTALLHAVHYLQTVLDCADNSFIHNEQGLWVHVPATKEDASDTYVRQATIPQGDSLLAQSTFTLDVKAGPKIDPVDSFPFDQAQPIPGLNDVTHHIPFVVQNANASQMDAIFWIENVTSSNHPDGSFLQLQYVQRVILDFDNKHWPHFSVATLVKSA